MIRKLGIRILTVSRDDSISGLADAEQHVPPDRPKNGPPGELRVIAPGQVRLILRGESPRRVRATHPPVPSVAPVAEFKEKKGTNKTGEAYTGNFAGHRGVRAP